MKYIDFIRNLADDMQEELKSRNRDVKVEVRKVEKHWGTQFGIEVCDGRLSNPIIYPTDLYERFEEGANYYPLLDECIDRIEDALDNTPDFGRIDLESIKDSITMHVINLKTGEKFLKDKPHKKFEDLAIIYKLNVDMGENEKGTLTVTSEMMKRLGFNQETLHQFALERSPINAPCSIQNLTDTMKKLEPDSFSEMPESPLIVVTNEAAVLGAGAIFYPGVLEKCADVMNGNFYVLPSSTHEVLACREDGMKDLEELKMVVKEVNDTQIIPEELLSYNVYHYDWREKVFELADKYEKRMKNKAKQSVVGNLEAKKHGLEIDGRLKRNQDIGSRRVQGGSLCL